MKGISHGDCPNCKTEMGDLDYLMDALQKRGANSEVKFTSNCCNKPIRAYRELMSYYIEMPGCELPRVMIGVD